MQEAVEEEAVEEAAEEEVMESMIVKEAAVDPWVQGVMEVEGVPSFEEVLEQEHMFPPGFWEFVAAENEVWEAELERPGVHNPGMGHRPFGDEIQIDCSEEPLLADEVTAVDLDLENLVPDETLPISEPHFSNIDTGLKKCEFRAATAILITILISMLISILISNFMIKYQLLLI